MNIEEYLDIVDALPFGKQLPNAVYIYRYSGKRLHKEIRKLIKGAYVFYDVTRKYNVLKFHRDAASMSFLYYPTFLTEAHPTLRFAKSVRFEKHKPGEHITDYSKSENPPILHRKELMLPEGFPGREEMIALTKAEEELGLYENTSIIGTLQGWNKLLKEKGVRHIGHKLVNIK